LRSIIKINKFMKKIIIANWKMNPDSLARAKKFFNSIKNISQKKKAIICPPYTYLPFLKYKFLGSQNCHWENSGAFTGEISPKMLKSLGCKYVIIGHSERRKYFNETDEIINKKLKAALKEELIPILCIGEKKGEEAKKIVKEQLLKALTGLSAKMIKKIIFAYEPVWAIGTGNSCSAEKANLIRKFIKESYKNKILYGGSVNSKIADKYTKIGFDGLLIGGASLNVKEFKKILKNV